MQFKGPTKEELSQLVPDGLILLGYRGSISMGTWEPPDSEFSTDDKDLMGVAIGPLEHYLGLAPVFTEGHTNPDKIVKPFERFIGEWDVVTYELRRYVSLLCNANPNVLALLWLDPNMYLRMSRTGERLINARKLFSTKRIFHSFTGYAHGQIHKMTHSACEGYMGEKRKLLVERFGYDTKNAAHAIRLLRMGIEFLNEGILHVYREDRQQLLEIKHGEWTLDQVKREANRLPGRAEDAYDRCGLPAEVNMVEVNKLLVGMIRDYPQ